MVPKNLYSFPTVMIRLEVEKLSNGMSRSGGTASQFGCRAQLTVAAFALSPLSAHGLGMAPDVNGLAI